MAEPESDEVPAALDPSATIVPDVTVPGRRFAHLLDGPRFEGVEAAAIRPTDPTADHTTNPEDET